MSEVSPQAEEVLSESEITAIVDSSKDIYGWEMFEPKGDLFEAVEEVIRAAVQSTIERLLAAGYTKEEVK